MNAASVAAIAPTIHRRGRCTSRWIFDPLRYRLVGDEIVTRVQRLRHRAPRLHPRGIVGMRREPRLAFAAPFRRQLVVDVSVQFVFGDGNVGLGHCRRLCLFQGRSVQCLWSKNLWSKVCVVLQRSIPGRDLFRNLSMHNACHYYACHHFARHYFTRRSAVRSPSSDAFTWARARASRDITVPTERPGCRRPRGSSSLPASPAATPSAALPPALPARGRCRGLPPRCRWHPDCCRAAA